MIDPVTLNAHLKYVSQLLTEQKIQHTKYFSREEVSWIKININPVHYLYFHKGVINKPSIRLHNNMTKQDISFPFDDLTNPKVYQWLIQIIYHIQQTYILINQYEQVSLNR